MQSKFPWIVCSVIATVLILANLSVTVYADQKEIIVECSLYNDGDAFHAFIRQYDEKHYFRITGGHGIPNSTVLGDCVFNATQSVLEAFLKI